MSAFDRLENRLLNLVLTGSPDTSEQNPVVGLFTAAPAEAHSGDYGFSGEPGKGTAGTGYQRARSKFGPASNGQVTNVQPITITGLPAGTYTHFGVFGSST